MRARDINIAVHAVIDEGWAHGDFASNGAQDYDVWHDPAYCFQNPSLVLPSVVGFDIVNDLSAAAYGDYGDTIELFERASALLGEEYTPHGDVIDDPFWHLMYLFAAPGSDATAATADGFFFIAGPAGNGSGKPVILVTYKMNRFDADTFVEWYTAFSSGTIAYNASAGYEVYHFTIP